MQGAVAADREAVSVPVRSSRRRDRWEFLPALLEIQSAPPNPLGRLLLWLIIGLLCSALLWAAIGELEIIATAPGRLIASGHDKAIQPLDAGVVNRIRVSDGQQVRRGAPLIELDDTESAAEVARLEGEVGRLQDVMQRLQILLGRLNGTADAQLVPPVDETQRRLLATQWESHTRQLEALRQEQRKQQGVLQQSRVELARDVAILPLINERSDSYKQLMEKDYGARSQWLELEQQRIERTQQIAITRQQEQNQRLALEQIDNQRQRLTVALHDRLLQELLQSRQQQQGLRQELIKARHKLTRRTLYSPIDGTVQQLAVHTIGGVVTPAQRLMVIVPTEHQLQVQARVLNRDIGFVHPGQAVAVKLEAFPFTRYGTLSGRVVGLSGDAIVDEVTGASYQARIELERDWLWVAGQRLRLTPGMNLTVEIKTGRRRVIEYLLSPLIQHLQESGRER